MPAQIHKDDIGTQFRATLRDQDENIVDISAATTKEILFYKPDRTLITKSASYYTNGTDGVIQYTSVADDLDLAGMWRMQGHVVQSGTEFKTDIVSFKVHPNLGDTC